MIFTRNFALIQLCLLFMDCKCYSEIQPSGTLLPLVNCDKKAICLCKFRAKVGRWI